VKAFLHRVALGLAVIGLAGCNSLTGDALSSLRQAISGSDSGITAERIHAINASVLRVELSQSDALLVSSAAVIPTGSTEWYGLTEMLLTHGGRITQSAGLPTDLIAPLLADDPFVQGLHKIPNGLTVTRRVDYPAQYQTGLHQHARYHIGKVKQRDIMGSPHSLLRVDEHIHMPELGFKATNHYWVEPDTGLVRQSVQYLGPELPPLQLTLVKTQGEQRP
jgi:hypothetical protein